MPYPNEHAWERMLEKLEQELLYGAPDGIPPSGIAQSAFTTKGVNAWGGVKSIRIPLRKGLKSEK
jgi:hypothetical protein